MKIIIKLPFFIYMVLFLSLSGKLTYEEELVLLLLIGVQVFRERFADSLLHVLLTFGLICAGMAFEPEFSVLLALTVFDAIYKKIYIGIVPVIAAGVYFTPPARLPGLFLLMTLCGIAGFVLEKSQSREEKYKSNLDSERQLRYELEQARARLLASARETVRLTEVSERNRIARDIHDNVGHKLAGILMQLQAADKLYSVDGEKSREILQKSITSLAETVTLLRDTVHNLKPRENLGVEYIQTVIRDFGFCPVDFKFTGDFNLLPPTCIEILSSNIKEALTNASKHSGATRMEIALDINEKYVRLYIRDNGRGSARIKEGLGISGMKERVENLGGTISISGEQGFLIVCLLPLCG